MQHIDQLFYVGTHTDSLNVLHRVSVPNGHKVVLMVVFPSNTSSAVLCPSHLQ